MADSLAEPVKPAGARQRARTSDILLAGLGAFAGLAVVGALAATTHAAWLLGSFGASCVLLFGFRTSPSPGRRT